MFQLSNLKNILSNVSDLVFVNANGDLHVCKAPTAITLNTEVDKFHVPIELSFEFCHEENRHATSDDFIVVFSYKTTDYDRIEQQRNSQKFLTGWMLRNRLTTSLI